MRTERVMVAYGTGAERVVALRHVTARFESGKVACIMGPSGSGKSTLLAVLAGLRRPSDGAVWLGERRLDTLSAEALAEVRRQSIGLVFQNFRLLKNLNVTDNLCVAAEIIGIARDRQQTAAREALDAVGLSGKANRSLWELSGGEKQRIAIARALLGRPAVILADEPTAALDRENGIHCFQLLRTLASHLHCAVVIVTHDIRLGRDADVLWHMEDGVLSLAEEHVH